jgi:hypothetical protein
MASSIIFVLPLYLAIVTTSLLPQKNRAHILGAAVIGACLLLLDLPDIAEYKEHYQLAGEIGFYNILSLYNFEPGYVAIVALLSKTIPFEVFYILTITFAINAYRDFYCENTSRKSSIFIVCFLSICLYFVAFTIRTTIASIFLAYSLSCLKKKDNLRAALMIILGATFHAIITPLIILPVINKFSILIKSRYLFAYTIAIVVALISEKIVSPDLFIGTNELIDLKLSAYEDANVGSKNIYFGLWIVAAVGSIVSMDRFNEFDRVLTISMVTVILLLRPYEFFQGRFMWLTSFIFIYILTKGILTRFDIGKTGGLLTIITLPLLTFLRF